MVRLITYYIHEHQILFQSICMILITLLLKESISHNREYNNQRNKDLGSILMRIKTHNRMPYKHYNLNQNLLSALQKDIYNTDTINKIIESILIHGQYTWYLPHIKYDNTVTSIKTIFDAKKPTIYINKSNINNYDDMLVSIIHETMIILLTSQGIEYTEKSLHDAADILAIYLGYYEYSSSNKSIGLQAEERKYILNEVKKYCYR